MNHQAETKVAFLGSKGLGYACLTRMHEMAPGAIRAVFTVDDAGDARSRLDDFRSFCAQNDLELHICQSGQEAEQALVDLAPDIGFVICWYWLLPPRVLDACQRGYIGVHPSLLPKYRGGAPLVWSIMNNEPEVGFSVFSLAEGMDTGDIWHQHRTPLTDDMGIGELAAAFESETVAYFEQNYLPILRGEVTPQPQDHAKASYAAQRAPNHGWIDWRQPARRVFDFIRAQSRPYPGAFTYYRGEKVVIWQAQLVDMEFHATPGQVAMKDASGVFIVCGDMRPVYVESVDVGGQEMPARKAFRSIREILPCPIHGAEHLPAGILG
jgi:methionyl-tRNA formyltransferase